jgi:hypothetical protein
MIGFVREVEIISINAIGQYMYCVIIIGFFHKQIELRNEKLVVKLIIDDFFITG